MNKTSSPPIIRTDNNPQKFFRKFLVLGVLSVLAGIFFMVIGMEMQEQLHYFSKDSEVFAAMFVTGWGGVSFWLGIVIPIFMRILASKTVLTVYDDHIEGSSPFTGNCYETYDKISSVSTGTNRVSLNLSNGKSIGYIAYNAEAVASAIRARIS